MTAAIPVHSQTVSPEEIGFFRYLESLYDSTTGIFDFQNPNYVGKDLANYTAHFAVAQMASKSSDTTLIAEAKLMCQSLIYNYYSDSIRLYELPALHPSAGTIRDQYEDLASMWTGGAITMLSLQEIVFNDNTFSASLDALAMKLDSVKTTKWERAQQCEPGWTFVECNSLDFYGLLLYDQLRGTNISNKKTGYLNWANNYMRDPITGMYYFNWLDAFDTPANTATTLGVTGAWATLYISTLDKLLADTLYSQFKQNFVKTPSPGYKYTCQSNLDPNVDILGTVFALPLALRMSDTLLYNDLMNYIAYIFPPSWNGSMYNYSGNPTIDLMIYRAYSWVPDMFIDVVTNIGYLDNETSETNYNVTIFPNPFSQKTAIEFIYEQNEKYIFTLYNVVGQEVQQIENITSGQIDFERNNLNKGLYFFQLQNNSRTVGHGKLIIE